MGRRKEPTFHYVTMIDTFLSGWGPAEGKENIYMVKCQTEKDAEQAVRVGESRPEMERVKYRGTIRPRYNPSQFTVTEAFFDDLGPAWTGREVTA